MLALLLAASLLTGRNSPKLSTPKRIQVTVKMPIPGNPSDFVIPPGGDVQPAFIIPKGVYSKATWAFSDAPVATTGTRIRTQPTLSLVQVFSTGGAHYVPASAAQLADINAVGMAGGLLGTQWETPTGAGTDTVHAARLYLTPDPTRKPGRGGRHALERRLLMFPGSVIAHTTTYDQLTGNTFPMAYQVIDDYLCDWLFFSPGLFFDAGITVNSEIGVRIYPGIGANRGWNSVYSYPSRPAWSQLCDRDSFIPWHRRKVSALLEFYSGGASMGSTASIEFSLTPYSER